MLKYIYTVLLSVCVCVTLAHSQDLQTNESKPQDLWKVEWLAKLDKLDSMFQREQAQFRLMQSYQNEATEELILKDIDSLNVFVTDVNAHIDIANKLALPNTVEGRNGSETLKLKVGALQEYFEQCMLQIQVNNNLLQRKLKNESLDFKVSQINELKVKEYVALFQ
jgi:hypothetical protein